MVKKCFVLNEEVIDVFHNKFYITTIENCNFILLMFDLVQPKMLPTISFSGMY